MASIASLISYSSPLLPHCLPLTCSSSKLIPSLSLSYSNHTTRFRGSVVSRRNSGTKVFASSSASPVRKFSDAGDDDHNLGSKFNSVLFSLIQDIEPLDVSVIQKDVPPTTIDAINWTITTLLGAPPAYNKLQTTVQAMWEPVFFKLLGDCIITGYSLRNVEYRLCLEGNVEIHDHENNMDPKTKSQDYSQTIKGDDETRVSSPGQECLPTSKDSTEELMYNIPDFGSMTPEAREYILKLHSSLSSIKKELQEVKQQVEGDNGNVLLHYLRSLGPEKIAELSEPTSPELKDMIHSVVHGLLATLSPHILVRKGTSDVQFQALIPLTRDYVARLLFWCMLLGHYIRGLEYRFELMKLLPLPFAPTEDS